MSASPKKRASTSAKPKKVASHPPYQQMVKAAISHLKEAKGSSRAAILKYIVAHYKVGDNVNKVNARLRAALKRGVTGGALKQTKGTGASGSFRLADKAKASAKPKKAAPKKTTAAKKSPAKPKAKKSPKKPAAKKSPKKPKASPKKAKASPKKATKAKKSPKKAAK